MAIKLQELEATGTRWGAPTEDYPQGTFINGTGQGKRDGSYAKAEWANEIFGFHGAILKNGGETPNGQVETARSSQVYNALKKIIKNDIDTLGGDPAAVASGTVDAITATFTKPVSLEGGKLVKVRALGANTSPTVTFNPNGLGAKQVVKGDNDNLAVGDIAGAGYWITLIYDAQLDKWVLQNPATGVTLVLPEASESTKGIIKIASDAEILNGTSKESAVTPKQAKDFFVPKSGAESIFFEAGYIRQNISSDYVEILIGSLLQSNSKDGGLISVRNITSPRDPGSVSLITRKEEGDVGPSLDCQSDGSIFWDGKNIDTINRSGDNWVRLESGLQIVWGAAATQSAGQMIYTFPAPFASGSNNDGFDASYSITVTPYSDDGVVFESQLTTNLRPEKVKINTNKPIGVRFIAIGRWK